jgi:hypothetical protein
MILGIRFGVDGLSVRWKELAQPFPTPPPPKLGEMQVFTARDEAMICISLQSLDVRRVVISPFHCLGDCGVIRTNLSEQVAESQRLYCVFRVIHGLPFGVGQIGR